MRRTAVFVEKTLNVFVEAKKRVPRLLWLREFISAPFLTKHVCDIRKKKVMEGTPPAGVQETIANRNDSIAVKYFGDNRSTEALLLLSLHLQRLDTCELRAQFRV
jgi:hypothetical protein